MAITGRRFSASSSQLTTSATTLYTATNVKAQIQAFTVLNTSGGAVTVTIHIVPSGGSASNSNMIVQTKSLNAAESYKVIEAVGQWLSAGDTIQALASANTAISSVIGGIEVT